MSYPKPDGYRGGTDEAAEFIGVTLGTGNALHVFATNDDDLDWEKRRGAVTNHWMDENC